MAKKAYRVRNWQDYNKSLVRRGSLTFWFSEELVGNLIPTAINDILTWLYSALSL